MFNHCLCLIFFFIIEGGVNTYASSESDISVGQKIVQDSEMIQPIKQVFDSVRWMRIDTISRSFKRQQNKEKRVSHKFNEIDTTYIEPQKYNFTVMVQNTNTYEVYRLSNASGQGITFAPEATIRIGPYVGWRWIFLGYTLDIKHLDFWHHENNPRQELIFIIVRQVMIIR